MSGEKRENPNKDQNLPDAKKQKLNENDDEINLSPIRKLEQDEADEGDTSEEESNEQPKTPDTQPLNGYMNDANNNNEENLSSEEQDKIIKSFQNSINQLKTNQPGSADENHVMVLTKTNSFSLYLYKQDFFKLPLNTQDELLSELCEAIQHNAQIKSLGLHSADELTSAQTEKLKLAARNPSIKSITLREMHFEYTKDAAQFFESVVSENPSLEKLSFMPVDFDVGNSDFTGHFQNPNNAASPFTQPALKTLEMKLYNIKDFNIIYPLIEKNQNVKEIYLDCEAMNIEVGSDFATLIYRRLYEELNRRLKTNYEITTLDLIGDPDNLDYREHSKESSYKIFDLLIKRNQDLNQNPAHKNLILYFYAGLDKALADMPNEALSLHHRSLLEYVTTKDGKVNIKDLSVNELKLLDRLLETRVQFEKEKLNEVFEISYSNHSETMSARHEAKSNFDAIFAKSQTVKGELIKRSQQPQIAAALGKDIYSNSASSAETPTNQLTTSQREWLGMSF